MNSELQAKNRTSPASAQLMPIGDVAALLQRPAEARDLVGELAVRGAIAGADGRLGVVEGGRHHLAPQPLVEMHQGMVDIALEQGC